MTSSTVVKHILNQIPFVQLALRYRHRIIAREQFRREFAEFKRMSEFKAEQRFTQSWKDRHPCLDEKTAKTSFDHHYIYHTAWAARLLAQTRPPYHVDISSKLYFSTLVSAFIPVKFYDYRPVQIDLPNLSSGQADILSLPFPDGNLQSLSCMHVIEHIGLGRYGDSLDPDGDLKAITELKRVLKVGGSLLFVVPVGQPKILFNAHRIYSYEQIVSYFPEFYIDQFALVNDRGEFKVNATPNEAAQQSYGCGCWYFVKK